MSQIIFRPYTQSDFSACLALFDGNVPTYFAPDERAEFQEHLENLEASFATYIVLERGGAVVPVEG